MRAYSSVWAPKEWPTAPAGAAYIIAITLLTTLPGVILIVLPGAITALRRFLRRGPRCCSSTVAAPSSPAASHAGDYSFGWGGKGALTLGGGTGSTAVVSPFEKGPNELEITLPAGEAYESEVQSLFLGRPDVRKLVGSWLAAVRQLPSGEVAGGDCLQVGCYAMGPNRFVSEVQLMCWDVNRGCRLVEGDGAAVCKAAGGRRTFMRFVRKTHEL